MPGLWGAGNHAESMATHRPWSIFGLGEDQTSKFDFIFEESAATFGYTISDEGARPRWWVGVRYWKLLTTEI